MCMTIPKKVFCTPSFLYIDVVRYAVCMYTLEPDKKLIRRDINRLATSFE